MAKSKILNIEQHSIHIVSHNNEDYLSLTDMARSQMEDVIIIKLKLEWNLQRTLANLSSDEIDFI